jgi:hypothetical protein
MILLEIDKISILCRVDHRIAVSLFIQSSRSVDAGKLGGADRTNGWTALKWHPPWSLLASFSVPPPFRDRTESFRLLLGR